jgi:hypothetical protein
MVGEYRRDLDAVITRSEAAILDIIRQIVPTARLKRIGPIDIGEPAWSCWIVTDTDEQRERLTHDSGLRQRLNETASRVGLAPDSFTFQSQETVDRDYEGNWFYAMR